MAETFDKMYLFVRNLHDSLNAHLITSTMLETYVFVVIDIFKITILATQYVKRGNSSSLIGIINICRILLEGYVRPAR